MRRKEFTDAELLSAFDRWPEAPTYVLGNVLHVETPRILRRLKRLERENRVKRVPSNYAVMLVWSRVDP